MSPVLLVFLWVATVVVFAAVARRVLDVPLGAVRAALSAVLAVGVGLAVSDPLVAVGSGVAEGSLQVGISLVAALTFLVVAEILVPTGSWPSPLEWRRSVRRRSGRSRRYARILAIAVRHGLGPYLRFGSQSPAGEPQRRRRLAKSVRQAMEDGGVTFVKLGQLASTRPDLLPAEFIDEGQVRWGGVRGLIPRGRWSGREGLQGGVAHLLCDDGVGDLCSGEDVESEVAAAFGPFVVLLGQHRSDESDDAGSVGEDPDDVGAAADLAVEPLLGVVGPDLAPDGLGNPVKARMSARAASRCSATPGSLSVRASRTRSNWACTEAVSGWS